MCRRAAISAPAASSIAAAAPISSFRLPTTAGSPRAGSSPAARGSHRPANSPADAHPHPFRPRVGGRRSWRGPPALLPGFPVTYCVLQDLIDRFGNELLVQLTDRSNIPATTIDETVVDRAIGDA